jgi:hypothetical protein
MIKYLCNKYKTWRFAKSQKYKVNLEGTLLHAFYQSKIVFIHIPKTAGVSILKAIYGVVSLESHRSFYFNKVALNMKDDVYFTFSFIRNPLDRLYSTYKFLEKGGMNKHDEIAFNKYLSKFKDFEDFVINGLNSNLIQEITHLKPQHEYICDYKGKILVDYIGRFENLEDHVKIISKKINKQIILPHFNKNEKENDSFTVYTTEMVQKVKNIYKDDFELLDYRC